MSLSRRTLLSVSAMAGLSGCGALSAVSRASAPLDTFTLTPLGPAATPRSGAGHLVVEVPTAGGALSTDRILIKVSPRQAQYLPDARWAEPVPAMVQTLLVTSLLNRGGLRLVTRVGAGLMPDHTLMTEITAFQAELVGPDRVQVRIALQMTLIREADRSIAGTRRVEATVASASDGSAALVAALDAALQTALGEAIGWVQATP